MDSSTLISFATFAMVSAFTPGPNNVMLAASGANFGFRGPCRIFLAFCLGFVVCGGRGLGLATYSR